VTVHSEGHVRRLYHHFRDLFWNSPRRLIQKSVARRLQWWPELSDLVVLALRLLVDDGRHRRQRTRALSPAGYLPVTRDTHKRKHGHGQSARIRRPTSFIPQSSGNIRFHVLLSLAWRMHSMFELFINHVPKYRTQLPSQWPCYPSYLES